MFHKNPPALYTMIVKSLVHCWNNFERKIQGWPTAGEVKNYKIFEKMFKRQIKVIEFSVSTD